MSRLEIVCADHEQAVSRFRSIMPAANRWQDAQRHSFERSTVASIDAELSRYQTALDDLNRALDQAQNLLDQ